MSARLRHAGEEGSSGAHCRTDDSIARHTEAGVGDVLLREYEDRRNRSLFRGDRIQDLPDSHANASVVAHIHADDPGLTFYKLLDLGQNYPSQTACWSDLQVKPRRQ